MKASNKITIECSSSNVWKVLYKEFYDSHAWMSTVKSSYGLPKGQGTGRVCHFTDEGEKGFSVVEKITYVDEKRKSFSFTVESFNAPAFLPFKENDITIEIIETDDNKCLVLWETHANVNLFTSMFAPLFQAKMEKRFQQILKDLKKYVETREVA